MVKFSFPSRAKGKPNIPADILDTPKELIVPGLSKSEIHATVEGENTPVIRSEEKRKREDGEEGCRYLRLERRATQELLRKFRLPENADVSAISTKFENGELIVVVGKLSPPKPKTVEVTIA